jgi:hypothetical protein
MFSVHIVDYRSQYARTDSPQPVYSSVAEFPRRFLSPQHQNRDVAQGPKDFCVGYGLDGGRIDKHAIVALG